MTFDEQDERGWFAIRRLFLFGVTDDGRNVFEERIVVFHARTAEEAHARADQEALEYAAFHGFVLHPDADGYEQDGEWLIDGYEV